MRTMLATDSTIPHGAVVLSFLDRTANIDGDTRERHLKSLDGGAPYASMRDHVRYSDSGTKVIGTLHPKNIISTFHVTIHTENIGNLRSARGSISGMASGRKFAADRPNDNSMTVTHPIEADE